MLTTNPGDLIIVDPTCIATGATPAAATCSAPGLHPGTGTPTQTASPAAHTEMLIMWKPVRLQGVGAASSIINANAHPAGKLLDPWRARINCLFGLTLDGFPQDAAQAFCEYKPQHGARVHLPGCIRRLFVDQLYRHPQRTRQRSVGGPLTVGGDS